MGTLTRAATGGGLTAVVGPGVAVGEGVTVPALAVFGMSVMVSVEVVVGLGEGVATGVVVAVSGVLGAGASMSGAA